MAIAPMVGVFRGKVGEPLLIDYGLWQFNQVDAGIGIQKIRH